MEGGGHTALAEIRDEHTNIIRIERDDEKLFYQEPVEFLMIFPLHAARIFSGMTPSASRALAEASAMAIGSGRTLKRRAVPPAGNRNRII